MAFPAVAAREDSIKTPAGTTHAVDLPAGVVSGDLLIVSFTAFETSSIVVTWPAGWTSLISAHHNASTSTAFTEIRYRVADGTEGATISITTNESQESSHRSWRISGQHTTSAPEGAAATGSSTTPNPPALDPAGWAAEDTLWLAIAAIDHGTRTFSAFPASYVNTFDHDGLGVPNAGYGERSLNAASEDPSTFTISQTTAWAAFTIAIRPAGGIAQAQTKTDPVGISSTVEAQAFLNIQQEKVDPVGLLDSIETAQGLGHARAVTDPVGLADSVEVQQGLGHVQEIVDPVGITDQAAGKVPYFPPSIPQLGARSHRLASADPYPEISCTIDGKPVLLGKDWSATARVNAGFDQFRGKILEEDLRRLRVRQFSTVRLWLPDARLLWEGRVSRPPAVQRGVAEVEAQGHHTRLVKADTRLLYSSADFGLWGVAESPPYNVASTDSEKFNRQVEHNCLRFSASKDTTYANGADAGLIAGCAGSPGGFTRLKGSFVSNNKTDIFFDAWDLKAYVDDYPGGTGRGTSEGTYDFPNTGSGSFDFTLDSTGTTRQRVLLAMQFQYVASPATLSFTIHWLLKDILLRGIAAADTMVASAVVADILGRQSIDTSLVDASVMNLLPYDVRDAQAWAEALTYIADIEDRWWAVWGSSDGGNPLGEYSEWSRVWTTDREHGCIPGLSTLERFNRAVVAYEDAAGAPQEVTADVVPDPLSSTNQDNELRVKLQDVQTDSTLASNVAAKLAEREGSPRWTGGVDLRYLRDAVGRGSAYSVRPGDLVRISDFEDPAALHRVVEVEYRADGVRLGIEAPSSIESMLGRQFPFLGPPPKLPPPEEQDLSSGPGPSYEAPEVPAGEGEDSPPGGSAPSAPAPVGGGGAQHHGHRHGPHWHHGDKHEGRVHGHDHWHPAGQHH